MPTPALLRNRNYQERHADPHLYITGTGILSKYGKLCLFNTSGGLLDLDFTFWVKMALVQADPEKKLERSLVSEASTRTNRFRGSGAQKPGQFLLPVKARCRNPPEPDHTIPVFCLAQPERGLINK